MFCFVFILSLLLKVLQMFPSHNFPSPSSYPFCLWYVLVVLVKRRVRIHGGREERHSPTKRRLQAVGKAKPLLHNYEISALLGAIFKSDGTMCSSKLQNEYNKIDHVINEHFCLFLSIMPKSLQSNLAPSLLQSGGKVQNTDQLSFQMAFLARRQGGFIELVSDVTHIISERKGRICGPD